MGDIVSTVALLRRMINHHDSRIHRLPPEILATVACHLENNTSLVTAAHVCHFWRTTLLSSPRLWTHLDFTNEECALVFLKRSKLALLSINLVDARDPLEIVRESLNEIATRVTKLQAEHGTFLDELLDWPMPMLEVLEVTQSDEFPPDESTHLPSLTSLIISGFDPLRYHAPLLTSFRLTHGSIISSRGLTTSVLLDFLRNCPLLEDVFLNRDVRPDSNEVVSLPFLHSFTHESTRDKYQPYLFEQLSLPSTCRVALVIDVTEHRSNPWIPGLPTLRGSFYLSDIRTIKITTSSCNPDSCNSDTKHVTFRTKLVDFVRKAISFDRVSYHSKQPSAFSHQDLFGIFKNIKITSVEKLCFEHYPAHTDFTLPDFTPVIVQELRKFQNLKTLVLVECNTTLFFDGSSSCPTIDTLVVYSRHRANLIRPNLSHVQKFAVSRKEVGYPLKTVKLVLPSAKPYASVLEELTNCVGSVKVRSDDDALG